MNLYINCEATAGEADLKNAIKQLFTKNFSVDKPVDNVYNFCTCGEMNPMEMGNFLKKAGIQGIFAHPKVLHSSLGQFVHSLGAVFCEPPAMDVEKYCLLDGVELTAGIFCQPESLSLLSCNLDDMTGEAIGFAIQALWQLPALDVWTEAIGMKKNRPGIKLCVLCKPEHQGTFLTALLRHTTSLGVRAQTVERYARQRTFETAETPFGSIRVKVTGGTRKPEFEDVATLARTRGLTYFEAIEVVDGGKNG